MKKNMILAAMALTAAILAGCVDTPVTPDKPDNQTDTTQTPPVDTTDVTPQPPDPGAPAAYGAVPTQGQVDWQRRELLMFYHYGQATFSGWDGENSTCNGKAWSESLLLQNYAPTTIDADQ